MQDVSGLARLTRLDIGLGLKIMKILKDYIGILEDLASVIVLLHFLTCYHCNGELLGEIDEKCMHRTVRMISCKIGQIFG